MRESLNYRCVDNGRISVTAEGVVLMDSFVRLCVRLQYCEKKMKGRFVGCTKYTIRTGELVNFGSVRLNNGRK